MGTIIVVSDSSSSAARPIPTVMLLTLALLSATAPLSIDMYLPAMPSIGSALQTDDSVVQLTLTTFMIGLAIGQLVIGPVSDALGRRRLLLVGTAVLLGTGVLAALSPTIEVLIVARFIQGFSGGIGVVLARAVISDRTTGITAAKLFSLMMVIGGLAPVVAPLIGGAVLGPLGWRGIFWILAGLAAVTLAAVWATVPETLPAEHRHPAGAATVARSLAGVLRNRVFVGYTLGFGFTFGALFSYISASPFVLQDGMGFSPGVFSLFFALNAVGLTASNFLNTKLIDHVAPRTVLRYALMVLLAIAVAMTVTVSIDSNAKAPLLVLMFLLTTTIGFVFGNATALAMDAVRDVAGSGSAVLGAFQFTVGAAVSPLVGLGAEASPVPMAISVLAVIVIASTAVFTLTRGQDAPA